MPIFASDPTPRATSAQLKYIDSLLDELNHDVGYVRDLCEEFEGDDLTDLTVGQASEVIEALLEEK